MMSWTTCATLLILVGLFIANTAGESEATSIQVLKIGYNNVFGYYIEVRNTQKTKCLKNGYVSKRL